MSLELEECIYPALEIKIPVLSNFQVTLQLSIGLTSKLIIISENIKFLKCNFEGRLYIGYIFGEMTEFLIVKQIAGISIGLTSKLI